MGGPAEAKEIFLTHSSVVFGRKELAEAYAASFGREGSRRTGSIEPAWRRFMERLR